MYGGGDPTCMEARVQRGHRVGGYELVETPVATALVPVVALLRIQSGGESVDRGVAQL